MKNIYHLLLVKVLLCVGCIANAQAESPPLVNGDIPLSAFKKTGGFTPNMGQVLDENYQPVTSVLAKSSLPGLDIYLTETGVSYVFLNYELDSAASQHPVYISNNNHFKVHYSRVDVNLPGATLTKSQLEFKNEETYKASYYYGDTKTEGISSYKDVTFKNVYPGIDWHWFINSKGQPEYDFVVHASYSSSVIKMQYRYADITPGSDNLLICTRNGALREGALKAFAAKQKVEASYNYNEAAKEITFNIGNYDTGADLIIDPPLVLQWSAQFGGNFADGLRGVACSLGGDILLTGYTTSVNFPMVRPNSVAYFDSTFNGNTDVIILKLLSNQTLQWATYAGGPGNDFGNSVAIDNVGQNFLITGGAQAGYPCNIYTSSYVDTSAGGQDILISRFRTNDMVMNWSTFYGGAGKDEGLKVACGQRIWITGYTHSGAGFPVYNSGTFNQLPADSFDNPFLLAFASGGTASRAWATGLRDTANAYGTAMSVFQHHVMLGGFSYSPKLNYFGGNPALLNNNGGADGFLVHFSQPGVPEFERFWGGSGNDYITDLTPNLTGMVVTGYTNSVNFPVFRNYNVLYLQPQLAGSYDAFVTSFENDTVPVWSTYYGGTAYDAATGIVTVSPTGILMTGFTFSNDFPTDSPQGGGYYQPVNKGNSDGFLTLFSLHGIRIYSTYKGDSCYEYPADIAVRGSGSNAAIYVCGEGLFACNQTLPDSGWLNGNGSGGGSGSGGFCWAFAGAPTSCLPVSIASRLNVCPDTIPGPEYGSAVVNYSGGQAPYTVIWSSGETGDTASLLPVGQNFVFVQDSNGCAGEATAALSPKVFSFNSSAGNCFADGSAVLYMNSGNSPFTYQWSTGATQASIIAPPGTYTATITDAVNCSISGNVTIPVLASTKYDIEVWQHPGCGNSNGILVARRWYTVNTYVPYVVAWYTSNNQYLGTNDTLYNAPPGTYYIDVLVCQNNQQVHPTVTLIEPGVQTAIDVTLEQWTPAGCTMPTGQVYVSIDGSSYNPYTYQWSNYLMQKQNISGAILSILQYGRTYTVTVTDSVGCSATASISPSIRDSILIEPIVNLPYCFNDNIGSIVPQPYLLSQGVGVFGYLWTGPGLISSSYGPPSIDSLINGTYEVYIYDYTTGCTGSFSWDIAPMSSTNLYLESEPVGCGLNPSYAKVTGITPHAWGTVSYVGSSRVDLQACKLEYSIVSPK